MQHTPRLSLDSTPVNGDLQPLGVCRWLADSADFQLLLRTALFGADLCLSLPPAPTRPPNRVPVEHKNEVTRQLWSEIEQGWIVPLPDGASAHRSLLPVAAIQVSVEPSKVRRITDYSNRDPRTGERRGVNAGVDVSELEPAVMDRAPDLAKVLWGIPQAVMLVRDMSKAFRRLAVRWRDVPWLSFVWNGQQLVDLRLPFGHAASAHIVCKLTQAIAHVITERFSPLATALVYVDDFLLVSHPSIAQEVETTFHTMMNDLGLPISAPKAAATGGWARSVEWIGFIHDARTMTHSLPDRKREALLSEVTSALRGVVQDGLQTLIGRLNHVACIFTPGRAFLRGLREWDDGPRSKVPPPSAVQDLLWWQRALPMLPGVAAMRHSPLPSDPVIATDASLWGIGMELVTARGSVSKRYWRNTVPYKGQVLSRARADLWPHAAPADMMTVEAAAALVAVKRWAPQLRGARIWLQLDNLALVHALSKGSSRHPQANRLIRDMLLTCVSCDVQVFPYHVSSENNHGADVLSRWQTLPRAPRWDVDELPPCHWQTLDNHGTDLWTSLHL